jgi:hypothetical protein
MTQNADKERTLLGRVRMPDDVARQLKVKTSTLRYWRASGQGPAYFRIHGRIAYVQDDVDSWVAERFAATYVEPNDLSHNDSSEAGS